MEPISRIGTKNLKSATGTKIATIMPIWLFALKKYKCATNCYG